jgi:hypothetical protein
VVERDLNVLAQVVDEDALAAGDASFADGGREHGPILAASDLDARMQNARRPVAAGHLGFVASAPREIAVEGRAVEGFAGASGVVGLGVGGADGVAHELLGAFDLGGLPGVLGGLGFGASLVGLGAGLCALGGPSLAVGVGDLGLADGRMVNADELGEADDGLGVLGALGGLVGADDVGLPLPGLAAGDAESVGAGAFAEDARPAGGPDGAVVEHRLIGLEGALPCVSASAEGELWEGGVERVEEDGEDAVLKEPDG